MTVNHGVLGSSPRGGAKALQKCRAFCIFILWTFISISFTPKILTNITEHNFGKFHKFTSYYRPWGLVAIFKIDATRQGSAKRSFDRFFCFITCPFQFNKLLVSWSFFPIQMLFNLTVVLHFVGAREIKFQTSKRAFILHRLVVW